MLTANRLVILPVLLVLFVFLAPPALAAPKVVLDGRQLSFDVPPVIDQGRVLVPMRTIFEALGANIEWDGYTRTVTAAKGQTTISLTAGSRLVSFNGSPALLDVPAKIMNGRTLVPLRFVSIAFDAEVLWTGGTQTVTITSAMEDIEVHFIDVGQGDAVYISLPNNNDILIDGGDDTHISAVVNYLEDEFVDDIELLIATHPHEDHIGGLDDVLAAFKVETVADNGMAVDTAAYRDYRAAVKAENCNYERADGQTWTYDRAEFSVIGPVKSYPGINDNSVVTLLKYGGVQILFTGDMETAEESDILSKLEDVDVLKVGYHGGATGTSQAFLETVRPETAIISVGAGNRYGHPAASTLQRLSDAGALVHRTDLDGAVVILADGKVYYVVCEEG
ncbi:MAG: stalk domain-containing protein [Bacillota bacterium]